MKCRISVRTLSLLALVSSALLAIWTGTISVFEGPVYEKAIWEFFFGSVVLALIPIGLIGLSASIFYDQSPNRKAASLGAFICVCVFLVWFVIASLTPAIPHS